MKRGKPRNMMKSYMSPKICVRASQTGKGIFALQGISKGEVVIDSAHMREKYISLTAQQVNGLPEARKHYVFQVDGDLYLVTAGKPEGADLINHSCLPNCGIKETLKVVAIRNIHPGEEITFDYAMSESSRGWRMSCACGKPNCRRTITGNDWKKKDVQRAYAGYFSAYIQKRIACSASERFAIEMAEVASELRIIFGKRLRALRGIGKKTDLTSSPSGVKIQLGEKAKCL